MKSRDSQERDLLLDCDEERCGQRYQWLLSSLPWAACLDVGKLFRRYLLHRDMSRALEEMQDIVIPLRMSPKRPLRPRWIGRKARQYLKTVIPWRQLPATAW